MQFSVENSVHRLSLLQHRGQGLSAPEWDLILGRRAPEYLLCARQPTCEDTKIEKTCTTCGQLERGREMCFPRGQESPAGFCRIHTTAGRPEGCFCHRLVFYAWMQLAILFFFLSLSGLIISETSFWVCLPIHLLLLLFLFLLSLNILLSLSLTV